MSQTELKHADLAAWVSINGHPVEIYSVEEKPGAKKTVGFIEARDGEAFSIHSRDDGGAAEHTVDWATEVHLDGKVMTSTVLQRTDVGRWTRPRGDPTRVLNFTGRPDTDYSEQPFLFSKPRLTDETDDACKDEHIIKNLGTIQVAYRRGFVFGGKLAVSYGAAPEETVLHEKAKKAMVSHQASLGASRPSASTSIAAAVQMQWIDAIEPLWTFEFRYLSRDLLEIQGHVEAKPDTKDKKRVIETITIDDDSDDDDVNDGPAVPDGDAKVELQRLRDQIARLEGEAGGKKKKRVKVEKGEGKATEVIEIED